MCVSERSLSLSFGCTCSIWKFLGQGSNLSRIFDLCHCCGNTGFLTPQHHGRSSERGLSTEQPAPLAALCSLDLGLSALVSCFVRHGGVRIYALPAGSGHRGPFGREGGTGREKGLTEARPADQGQHPQWSALLTYVPSRRCDEGTSPSWAFLPQIHGARLTVQTNPKHIPAAGRLQNTCLVLLNTVEVTEHKE